MGTPDLVDTGSQNYIESGTRLQIYIDMGTTIPISLAIPISMVDMGTTLVILGPLPI